MSRRTVAGQKNMPWSFLIMLMLIMHVDDALSKKTVPTLGKTIVKMGGNGGEKPVGAVCTTVLRWFYSYSTSPENLKTADGQGSRD